MAASSSPSGPPNRSRRGDPSTGSVSPIGTVYCSLLLRTCRLPWSEWKSNGANNPRVAERHLSARSRSFRLRPPLPFHVGETFRWQCSRRVRLLPHGPVASQARRRRLQSQAGCQGRHHTEAPVGRRQGRASDRQCRHSTRRAAPTPRNRAANVRHTIVLPVRQRRALPQKTLRRVARTEAPCP